MQIDLYIRNKSFLHTLHPLTKLFGMIFLFIPTFVLMNPTWAFSFSCFLIVLHTISNSLINVRSYGIFILMLMGSTLFIWTFLYPGPVSVESFQYGLSMGIRLFNVFLIGLLYLSVSPIEEFIQALMLLKIPMRVGLVLSLSFRLVPMLLDAAGKVVDAQQVRGLDLSKGSLFKRLQNYLPIMIPIFMLTLRRSNFWALALESKGIQSESKRSHFFVYKFNWKDLLALFVCILIIFMSLF